MAIIPVKERLKGRERGWEGRKKKERDDGKGKKKKEGKLAIFFPRE